MPLAELHITDGTITVDFLGNGLCLTDWRPSYPGMKGGGTWQSSPLADGRRLAHYRYDHIVDVFTLNGHGFTQDAMIRQLQELNRLLIKARQYWTADWQDEPVYLVAKSSSETNTRYALIHSYLFPEDGAPYGQPFAKNWGRIGMYDLTLAVEHALWQSTIPGEGDCTEVYATEDYEASVNIEEHVIASADDCYVEEVVNTINLGAVNIIFGRDNISGNDNNVGMRFQGVDVPQGATILWAYVQFQCFAGNASVTVNTLVSCEDADTTVTFSTYANFMGRARTAGVAWSPGAWLAGQFYYTPDIAAAVQTVVNRPLWVAGNDMVIFVDENGSTAAGTRRRADSFDGANAEPVLFIGYASDVTYGRERGGVCLVGDIEEHVVASLDDVHVEEGPNTFFNVAWLEFGRGAGAGNDMNTGMRFQGVDVPQGATILLAYVQFQAEATDALITVNVLVSCEAADTTVTFSTYANFMGRPRTAATSAWSPGAWTAGQFYDTPDIAPSVQEVISRPGWVAGNDMVVFVDENGSTGIGRHRLPASWDHATYREPVLFIGYSNQGQTYVANKHVMANIDHIYWYDASALMWSGNLVGTMPHSLFNPAAAIATGDYVLFGIETNTGAGPFTLPTFSSLVFDLIPAVYVGAASLGWSRSNNAPGAWVALTTRDNTAAAAWQPLSIAGVNSVHWEPQQGAPQWREQAEGPMGTTCLWLKLEATVGGGQSISVPQQQNRDVYHIAWPYIEVNSEDVGGDVAAIIESILENEADDDGADLDLWVNRVVAGLRSLDRGADFTAYLNCSDEQNITGVTVALGPNSGWGTNRRIAAGRYVLWTPVGAPLDVTLTITLDSTLAYQWYGAYRAFVRCAIGATGHVTGLQLRVTTGSGGVFYTSPVYTTDDSVNLQAVDLGKVVLPASVLRHDELQDQIEFAILATTTAGFILFADLILIPVDEWAGDFVDAAHTANSYTTEDREIRLDSLIYPKQISRALLATISTNRLRSIWQSITSDRMMLQSNQGQRLWFTFMRHISATETQIGDVEMAHSVDLLRTQRYLSMRGDR